MGPASTRSAGALPEGEVGVSHLARLDAGRELVHAPVTGLENELLHRRAAVIAPCAGRAFATRAIGIRGCLGRISCVRCAGVP